MNVMDVIRGNVNISSIDEKERFKTTLSKLKTDVSTQSLTDSVSVASENKQDVVRIKELQTDFLKNEVSLSGLQRMEETVSLFETEGLADTWNELSQQLHTISNETSFNGENVISYLSTEIRDDKGLYTFKMNLESEINEVNEAMNSERKQIATYLIENENKGVVSGFSPDKTVNDIVETLSSENNVDVIGNINNVNNLLIHES